MYYRIALVSQPTFTRDDSVWNVYQQLRCAGHAVELVNPARFPHVLNEDGSLNETAFAQFKRTFRPDYVSLGNETADEILSACHTACANNGTQPLRNPAKRFLVFGYLGKDNFGDELVFSIVRSRIAERWPEAIVTAIGQDPQATFMRHGVVSIEPNMKFEMDILMNGAAALLFIAGLVFDDPCFDWLAGKIDLFLNPYSEIPGQVSCVQLAWMHQVPSVYLGIGAGPLSNPDACALMRLAALCRPVFCARDDETARLLKEAGVDESLIERTADIALTLANRRKAYVHKTERPRIVAALRDFASVTADFSERVAQALDACIERYGAEVAFLDFAPEDNAIHQRVAKAMVHGETATFLTTESDEETLSVLGSAYVVFATRLHGSIVANAFGIPSVGFDYNEKVGSHYKLVDETALLCPMNATADEIKRALFVALDQHDALSEQLLQRTDELAAQSERNFAILEEAADSRNALPTPMRLYDKHVSCEAARLAACEQELRETRADADAARAEAARLERACEEMRNSTSWKAGRALTALPRFVKDTICK